MMNVNEGAGYSHSFHEINLRGGKPWGFSLSGGTENNRPLTIGKVQEGSKASKAGLEEEDVVLSIAEEECLSQSLAVSLIQKAEDQLTLIVQRGTIDSSTMKMGDFHYQGIPEESGNLKESYAKQQQRYIKREDAVEKSKDSAINRRIKKQNSQSSLQRPKSWHNTEISHSYSSSMDGSSPSFPNDGRNFVRQDSGSPSADAYASDIQKRSLEQFEVDHTGKLKMDEFEVSPGFVKRRVLNYGNSFEGESEKITYELEPAIIYPQVVSAMQVQNSQASMMPNGTLPTASHPPGVGVANFATVQMPQKQYASTADVYGGEAKVPPPLPTRVDSKNRTQQLSEHNKSSSWPATKPQTSSTTDTPTQSSVISPMNLPPVKLTSSQEQVYPSSQRGGPRYANNLGSGHRVPATVTSSSDFKLCVAQPVVIDEETATVTEDWFQAPKNHSPVPTVTWHANNSIHCPPSPPTRDIDPESSRDRRGPRYDTDDSLIKSYEAFLTEFEKQDVNVKSTDFSEVPHSPSWNELRGSSPRLIETVPPRTSPSVNRTRQNDLQDDRRVHRKNSLNGKSNERTWKNPNDFSVTAPSPLKVVPNNRKEIESSKEAEMPRPGRPEKELSLRGNAPRNRTPISLTLMAAVDLKEQPKGKSSPQGSRENAVMGGREMPTQSLSSEDQRKLEQISSGNSILSMLQRDRQKMSFFGDEDLGRKSGPEVASEQASPLSPVGIHYRQGSYDLPSRKSLEPSQRHQLYSSASALNHSSMSSLNSTIPENKGNGSRRSSNSRYHSVGASDYEVPDVSMETKLPPEQVLKGPEQQTNTNRSMRLNSTDRTSELVVPNESGDNLHSASDTEQGKSAPRQHYRKRSDPQLEPGGVYRSFRRHELNWHKRSPGSSRRSSDVSWSSSSGSSRSFSGDHYSSTSSLGSAGRGGQGDHGRGRYQSNQSPRSSPVDMNPRLQPSQGTGITRSASMNIVHVSKLNPHQRTNSYDHNSTHQSNSPDLGGTQKEAWRIKEQPRIPERSHSTAYMESRRHSTKTSPEGAAGEGRGQERPIERTSNATTTPSKMLHTTFRINPNSATNPVYRIPVEPEVTIMSAENVQTENASPLRVSTSTPPRCKRHLSPTWDDQPISPPLPPPPEEDEVPEEMDFPPPPPEFLIPRTRESPPRNKAALKNDRNNREVISVARVESIRVEKEGTTPPGKLSSPNPLVKNALVLEDINRGEKGSPVITRKSSPVPDNRVLDPGDNRKSETDDKEDEGTEKSSLENQEENHCKEDLPEINESEDPLVNRVLSFFSASQTSQLRKLFPDSRRGKRRLSRPCTTRMTNEEQNKYSSRKESLGPNEDPLSMSLSRYLQISPGRASLLNKAQGLQGNNVTGDEKDAEKLRNTKEELIERITRKVEELCNTQREVEQEIQETEELGRHLETTIEETCTVEVQKKYTTYVGDLEKVTKLLLNLSRKLTKVDSILHDLKGDNKENKEHLEKMRSNHASRYEDAKHLKESISQRHEDVSSQLKESLSSEDHEDFDYYVGVRCRLLVEAQDVADKIQLGNEQIQALKASLREHDKNGRSQEEERDTDVNGNCSETGRIKPFPS